MSPVYPVILQRDLRFQCRPAANPGVAMRFFLALLATVVLLGCSPPDSRNVGAIATDINVIAVSADGSTVEETRSIASQRFVGSYRVGDGLGYNLHLELKDARQFECKWHGCLGEYGAASGRWSAEGDGLKLVTERSSGMMKERPLGVLRVIALQESYLLLQAQDRGWFDEWGPDHYCCFHQESASEDLQQQQEVQRKKWAEKHESTEKE
jgi:hypothetical protein